MEPGERIDGVGASGAPVYAAPPYLSACVRTVTGQLQDDDIGPLTDGVRNSPLNGLAKGFGDLAADINPPGIATAALKRVFARATPSSPAMAIVSTAPLGTPFDVHWVAAR